MATPHTINCFSQMDIAEVGALYEQLSQVSDDSTVVFNASEVERIDAAALQLITNFVREANNRQIALSWESPSSAVLEAAQLLGLKDAIGLGSY